jgi:ACS family D-galactonate transporter-like MFS transporter
LAKEGMTHRRWIIGVLLGTGVLVNYIDRISLSVAAPQLQHDFGLTPQAVGFLFSAFFWSYSLAQLPGGLLLDRFGIKTVGRWGTFLWSVASGATALCSGYAGIFTARLLLGIAEAPGMIGNQKATGLWFPTRERCRSTAIFDSAAKFANVIGVPIVAFFVVGLGWRWGFAVTAFLSFLCFAAYWLMYRDPSEDKHLSRQEHAYILAGGAVPEGQAVSGQANMLAYVLQNRKVWAHMIGYSAYGYSFYLFLTWLPGYLVESLHMSILKSAGFATIPWIFASLADLLIGGFFVDYLIGRGLDESKVRKVAIAIGMAAGLAVFGAAYTNDPFWALVWITIALSGLSAAAPVASSIVSLISPRGATATIGGIVNLTNNLMGVAAPVITGFIVGLTHSFAGAFLVAGVVLIVGIFSYLVLLGRIEPIPDPPARM